MKLSIILDTSFLIAVFTKENNENKERAKRIYELIKELRGLGRIERIYILWPVCYEFFGTRVLKSKESLLRWEKFQREFRKEIFPKGKFEFGNDTDLRKEVFVEMIEEGKPPSLVDRIIGKFLVKKAKSDPTKKFLLVTFDSDFYRYCVRPNIFIVQNPEALSGNA